MFLSMGAYGTKVDTVGIDVVNIDQAAAWDGHEGDVWTEHADRYDRASRRIWTRFVEADLVACTDRVLDVGCGTGGPTRDIAHVATNGEVTGIDLSTRMLELARERSADEGLDNVTFVRGDAQVFPFEPAELDVAMSSFGSMFFSDPVAAFANISGGLHGGGTLALLAWRALRENDWLMSLRGALAVGRELPMPPPDAPTPFALADPERVRTILGAAGFQSVELEPIDEPIDLGAGASDALAFAETMGIVDGLTHGLDAQQRAEAMTNLANLLHDRETAEGVLLASAARLITSRASVEPHLSADHAAANLHDQDTLSAALTADGRGRAAHPDRRRPSHVPSRACNRRRAIEMPICARGRELDGVVRTRCSVRERLRRGGRVCCGDSKHTGARNGSGDPGQPASEAAGIAPVVLGHCDARPGHRATMPSCR